MTKKVSEKKRIIEEALRAEINEGPISFLKGLGSDLRAAGAGVANMARTGTGNMQIGKIASQVGQFEKKVDNAWEMHGERAAKAAEKLQKSGNPAISDMGAEALQHLDQGHTDLNRFLSQLKTNLSKAAVNTPTKAGSRWSSQDREKASSESGNEHFYIKDGKKLQPHKSFQDWLQMHGQGSVDKMPAAVYSDNHREWQRYKNDYAEKHGIEDDSLGKNKKSKKNKKNKFGRSLIGVAQDLFDLSDEDMLDFVGFIKWLDSSKVNLPENPDIYHRLFKKWQAKQNVKNSSSEEAPKNDFSFNQRSPGVYGPKVEPTYQRAEPSTKSPFGYAEPKRASSSTKNPPRSAAPPASNDTIDGEVVDDMPPEKPDVSSQVRQAAVDFAKKAPEAEDIGTAKTMAMPALPPNATSHLDEPVPTPLVNKKSVVTPPPAPEADFAPMDAPSAEEEIVEPPKSFPRNVTPSMSDVFSDPNTKKIKRKLKPKPKETIPPDIIEKKPKKTKTAPSKRKKPKTEGALSNLANNFGQQTATLKQNLKAGAKALFDPTKDETIMTNPFEDNTPDPSSSNTTSFAKRK